MPDLSYDVPAAVQDLLERSHRLGADPTVTNYAGGNASAKAEVVDPASGETIDVMWVKGSGGDLGTLQFTGLAALRLDALRALRNVYRGPQFEDEMVAAFDYCLFGKGGAAPSIDTAMHGLVTCAHVDHLHPDSGIALATSADGEALTRTIFGDRVAWTPWRRPGFQLGLDIAAIRDTNPHSIGVILGGHGITAWGDTSEECEENALFIIRTAEHYIAEHGRRDPLGVKEPKFARLAENERRAKAIALFPTLRGMASTDRPQVGHFFDTDTVLSFLECERHAEVASRGSSCPDHFLRTKVRPMILDVESDTPVPEMITRLGELHSQYRDAYSAYYRAFATSDSPAMRGADPAIILVPGVGMFSFGKDAQTARVAGEFFINAINVMTGAEAISTYTPIEESEKFRIEYWQLEEEKLRRMPKAKPLTSRVALVTGGGSGIGAATARRLAAEGAHVIVADLDVESAVAVARELGSNDVARGVAIDVSSKDAVQGAVDEAVLAFGGVDILINNAGLSISKSLLETTERDWDLQHDVMAKGSFLAAQSAVKVMKEQEMGGDIIYIVSKNAVFAGPNNVAYGSAKADQAHQVRLLAAELGELGIRVNGINPDGVVRDSKIFAGGWGAQRAAVYGVKEEDLGAYYAGRTLLKREVVPESIASAVFALLGGDLALTTGAHIPVDSGVAAAFLR
ncbi:MAG TPA: bifunctional aldolase/short-chain dehydrogenase [Acidimicrobiales bacterium]